MTESQRPSGEHTAQQQSSSTHSPDSAYAPGAGQTPYPPYGDAAYPPPPPYEPARPIAAGPGTTVWPGPGPGPEAGAGYGGGNNGGGGHGLPYAPLVPAGPTPPKRAGRARGPVALLAAVAIAAAVVGGGSATLVAQLTDHGTHSTASGSVVSGTTVSQSSAGTVAGVAKAVSPAIVEIGATSTAGESTGSGVVVTADGEIVTNNHVVSGAASIQVTMSTGRTYTAEIVGTDPDKDLALIKLKGASGLKTAALGDSSSVRVGDQVVAIGSPEGLTGTVTSGIVSALDRDVTVAKEESRSSQEQQEQQGQGGGDGWPFEFGGQQFNGDTGTSKTTYKAIQTDASLNPGNSGGALINMNGEIIGINSAMYSPSSSGGSTGSAAGSVGLGFAIPVDTVKADLKTLRAGDGI
ncbi:trypsin-like peptidase domain-containing protein [Streptomyces sp. AM 4-1-1]|uniref:S1C family serine protease n=1 Tax=Streptomyces sp. AM 4-1-1 TaxID=3028710 RepID=UPI0023B998FC|nr:trypsin-like peptidase domain-containing protein [Streptomyces sp. AM 4-1-1]WEH34270.1 trypsin-like peptidase domain-containing protein [Streptomyces sp. AM 4-1-1]